MARSGKFTEEQRQEIRGMKLNLGKSNKEIKEHFKKTYNIDVSDANIYQTCAPVPSQRKAEVTKYDADVIK